MSRLLHYELLLHWNYYIMSRYEPLLHYESLLHYKLQQRFLIFNRFTSKILSLFFVSYVQHSHLAFKYLKSTIIHGFHFP